MKKTLLYTAIAVISGLSLTLIPLTVLADMQAENHYDYLQSLGLTERTANGSSKPAFSAADIQTLAVSFIIALAVYVLFKRRTPSSHNARID